MHAPLVGGVVDNSQYVDRVLRHLSALKDVSRGRGRGDNSFRWSCNTKQERLVYLINLLLPRNNMFTEICVHWCVCIGVCALVCVGVGVGVYVCRCMC